MERLLSNGWIADRLAVGHANTVSRVAKDEKTLEEPVRTLEVAMESA